MKLTEFRPATLKVKWDTADVRLDNTLVWLGNCQPDYRPPDGDAPDGGAFGGDLPKEDIPAPPDDTGLQGDGDNPPEVVDVDIPVPAEPSAALPVDKPPMESQEPVRRGAPYASFRGHSALSGKIIGADPHSMNVRNKETGAVEQRTMY